MAKIKDSKLIRRRKRARSKIFGTRERPRLSVFRSNKYVYAQIIDDENQKTILGLSESALKTKKGVKTEKARVLGKIIAQRAAEIKIKKVTFDRGGRDYHGRVKALAEGAREGGLKF